MADVFQEDMGKRIEWFQTTRGRGSVDELNERWHDALAQTQLLRTSRTLVGDPGGRSDHSRVRPRKEAYGRCRAGGDQSRRRRQ